MITNTFIAKVLERLHLLEQEQEEARKTKEIILAGIESDEEYMALKQKAQDATKLASACKQALLNEPASRKAQENLKELTEEIKDIKQTISDNLIGYFTESQRLDFEDSQGQLHRFTVSAKVNKTDQASLF